jgi:predicted nucleic acid-binding protein
MALRAILDTRFYFSYYNPESRKVAAWSKRIIQRALRGEFKVASSTITIAELYGTMGRMVGTDAVKLRVTSIKASNIPFLPVTEDIAHLAGRIILETPRRIPLADAIIAATALINAGGLVVTDDEHFQLVKDVKTSWLSSI